MLREPISATPPPDARCLIPDARSRNNLLITLLLDGSRPLDHIAEALELPILDLIDLIEQPHIKRALDSLSRISNRRAQLALDIARPIAAQVLVDLMTPAAERSNATVVAPVSPQHPIEAIRHNESVRKAASLILHRPRAPATSAENPPPPPPPAPAPARAPAPAPATAYAPPREEQQISNRVPLAACPPVPSAKHLTGSKLPVAHVHADTVGVPLPDRNPQPP